MIKQSLALVASVSIIAISVGYLNNSDTPSSDMSKPENAANAITGTQASSPPTLTKSTSQDDHRPHQYGIDHDNIAQANDPDISEIDDDHQSSALISDVMDQFESMEDILENIEHPSVQAMIKAMPQASQKTIKMAALKQSVSKRLDQIENNLLSPIDLPALNKDIDTLAKNLVMMPEEARTLKAYLQRSAQQRSNI